MKKILVSVLAFAFITTAHASQRQAALRYVMGLPGAPDTAQNLEVRVQRNIEELPPVPGVERVDHWEFRYKTTDQVFSAVVDFRHGTESIVIDDSHPDIGGEPTSFSWQKEKRNPCDIDQNSQACIDETNESQMEGQGD